MVILSIITDAEVHYDRYYYYYLYYCCGDRGDVVGPVILVGLRVRLYNDSNIIMPFAVFDLSPSPVPNLANNMW